MEAVPRLPMISFELKVSPDQSPVEFSKLKQVCYCNRYKETISEKINLETIDPAYFIHFILFMIFSVHKRILQ